MTKAQAKAYIDANYTLIVMHTLYQRWGLPTALLKPLVEESPVSPDDDPHTADIRRRLAANQAGGGLRYKFFESDIEHLLKRKESK